MGSGGGGSGGVGGIECEEGKFFNYTSWQCEVKLPEQLMLNPYYYPVKASDVLDLIILLLFFYIVLSFLFIHKRIYKEGGGA